MHRPQKHEARLWGHIRAKRITQSREAWFSQATIVLQETLTTTATAAAEATIAAILLQDTQPHNAQAYN